MCYLAYCTDNFQPWLQTSRCDLSYFQPSAKSELLDMLCKIHASNNSYGSYDFTVKQTQEAKMKKEKQIKRISD